MIAPDIEALIAKVPRPGWLDVLLDHCREGGPDVCDDRVARRLQEIVRNMTCDFFEPVVPDEPITARFVAVVLDDRGREIVDSGMGVATQPSDRLVWWLRPMGWSSGEVRGCIEVHREPGPAWYRERPWALEHSSRVVARA